MRRPAHRPLAFLIACAVAATACAGDGRNDAAWTTSPTIVLGTPPATVAAPAAPVAPPEVDAAAYTVLDVDTGSFLAEREADTPRAVGSVTKLLTAYVIMQAGDPTHVVTVPPMQIDPMESVIGLQAGEQLPRDVLLRAMLIVSANDAARALAVDLAGSETAFADRMNTAAAELGLTNTHSVNPVGLDADGAHSTARDMARLAAVLMDDETFRHTAARSEARLHGQVFPATNDDFLLAYPGANGVKTGSTTRAGSCLVASATRDGRTLIAVVLGASSATARTKSAIALLDWAFAQPP
jgi:serine-type D-Ala-D-Ala carboxypeptidase (penicillin-binding protein 5/6)